MGDIHTTDTASTLCLLSKGRTHSTTSLRKLHVSLSHAEEGDVRMQGGKRAEDGNAEFGRLEIFHRGGWGDVYIERDMVNISTLIAACRAFGYTDGAQVRLEVVETLLNGERVPSHVDARDLRCTGSDANLEGCAGFQLGSSTGFPRFIRPLTLLCFNNTNSGTTLCSCPYSTGRSSCTYL